MDQDKLWARFTRTGKVTDYLQYCGVDVVDESARVQEPSEEPHEADHRSSDHSGKQQYR